MGGKSHEETLLLWVEKDPTSDFSSASSKEKWPHLLEELSLKRQFNAFPVIYSTAQSWAICD